MKKRPHIQYPVFSALLCMVGCFFSVDCGLDKFYLLEEPTTTNNISYATTGNYTYWYVDFETNERGNAAYYPSAGAPFTFLGTEVYYKIYNSQSTLSLQKSNISKLNTSSNYASAATRMIETYGYKPLGTYPAQNWTPFVECREHDQHVEIRLKAYNKARDGNLAAHISFDEKQVTREDGALVEPYRNGNQYSFDFFNDADDTASNTPNREPQEGDEDYQYTSGASTGTYYVQLYAVAVGRDANYTPSYSLVLDLGTIPIAKE